MQSRAKPRHSCFSSEDDREDSSDEEEDKWQLNIGWPTSVEHKEHVTFDPFEGYLGLPQDFAKEVPAHPPSASKNVFGVSPSSMQCSFDDHGNSVPTILLLLQTRLYNQGGLKAEGIFRVAARIDHEEHVQKQLNEGTVPKNMDVYALAGLIKRWLRDLPDGVLDALADTDVEKVSKSGNEEAAIKLVEKLPGVQRSLLDWTVNLMADVVEYEEQNLMNIHNIATVFAPNLIQLQIEDAKAVLFHAAHVMKLLKLLVQQKQQQRQIAASAFSGSYASEHGNSVVGGERKEAAGSNFASQNGVHHGLEEVSGTSRFSPLNGSPLSRDQPLPETLPAGFVREGEEEEKLEGFVTEVEEEKKTTIEVLKDAEEYAILGEERGHLGVVLEAADLESEEVLEEARAKQALNGGSKGPVLEDEETVVDATMDAVEDSQTPDEDAELKRIFSIAHSTASNDAVSDPDAMEPMERIFSIAISTTSSIGVETTCASEVEETGNPVGGEISNSAKFLILEVAPGSLDEAPEDFAPVVLDECLNLGATDLSRGIVEMERSSICPVDLEDTASSSPEGQIVGHHGVVRGLDFIGVEGAVAPVDADVKVNDGVIQMEESPTLIKLEDFLSFSQFENTSSSLKVEEVARPSDVEDGNRAYSLDGSGDLVETEIGELTSVLEEGRPIEMEKMVYITEMREDAGPLRLEEAVGLFQIGDGGLGSGLGEFSDSMPVEGSGTGTEVVKLSALFLDDGAPATSSVDRIAGHIGQEEYIEVEGVDGSDDIIVSLNNSENAESTSFHNNVVTGHIVQEEYIASAEVDRVDGSEDIIVSSNISENAESSSSDNNVVTGHVGREEYIASSEVDRVDGSDDVVSLNILQNEETSYNNNVPTGHVGREEYIASVEVERVDDRDDIVTLNISEKAKYSSSDINVVNDARKSEDEDGLATIVDRQSSEDWVIEENRDEKESVENVEPTSLSQVSSAEVEATDVHDPLVPVYDDCCPSSPSELDNDTIGQEVKRIQQTEEVSGITNETAPKHSVDMVDVSEFIIDGHADEKQNQHLESVRDEEVVTVTPDGCEGHPVDEEVSRQGFAFDHGDEEEQTTMSRSSSIEAAASKENGVLTSGSVQEININGKEFNTGGDVITNLVSKGEIFREQEDKVTTLKEFSPGVEEGHASEVVEEGSGTHTGGGEEVDMHLRELTPKVDKKAFSTSPSNIADEFLLPEGVSGIQPTAALPRPLHL